MQVLTRQDIALPGPASLGSILSNLRLLNWRLEEILKINSFIFIPSCSWHSLFMFVLWWFAIVSNISNDVCVFISVHACSKWPSLTLFLWQCRHQEQTDQADGEHSGQPEPSDPTRLVVRNTFLDLEDWAKLVCQEPSGVLQVFPQ